MSVFGDISVYQRSADITSIALNVAKINCFDSTLKFNFFFHFFQILTLFNTARDDGRL